MLAQRFVEFVMSARTGISKEVRLMSKKILFFNVNSSSRRSSYRDDDGGGAIIPLLDSIYEN